MDKHVLEFYKKTSPYTDLGLYKDFAKSLPNDVQELCLLQRNQIIHPIAFENEEIRNSRNCFWGDMTQISDMNLLREDDIFPNAISMLAELLRRDTNYSLKREAKNKIFVTCRGQAILLVAILKSKGIPARVRSGFSQYVCDGICVDHWLAEYYNTDKNKWCLVDADCCCNEGITFDIYDVPQDQFLSAAQVWIKIRENGFDSIKLKHAYYGDDMDHLIMTLTTALFYDFHCLMNDEIIYLHYPKYLKNQQFKLTEKNLKELDELAELMLNPDQHFDSLYHIWENKAEYRIMTGGSIHH